MLAVTGADIERIAGRLLEHGYVGRGFLGIALQPVALPANIKEKLRQDSGIMLLGVEPEGPAATSGLILGDVLIAAGGNTLAGPEALAELLERTAPGQIVKFQIIRGGVVQDLDVRIGERPSRKS